jgi:hypothetical protein
MKYNNVSQRNIRSLAVPLRQGLNLVHEEDWRVEVALHEAVLKDVSLVSGPNSCMYYSWRVSLAVGALRKLGGVFS